MRLNKDTAMIKIGYIVETPVTVKEKKMAGAQLSFLSLVIRLKTYDIEPFVVVAEKWDLTDEFDKYGINYMTTPIHAIFIPLNGVYKKYHGNFEEETENEQSLGKIVDYFSKNKVQMIHINSEFCGIVGAQAAKILGIPYIFHIREFLEEDFGLRFKYEELSKKLIGESSLLIAISESIHSHLTKLYPSSRIITIYNGVDEKKYSYSKTRLKNHTINIAIAGRIVEYKGQFDAIHAVEYIIEQGVKNIKLLIIGFNKNTPNDFEKILYNYVEYKKLNKYVIFIPFTNKIEEELKHCDIGLMCSRKEAFGRVTVEYMMSDMLAIGTNSGGTPEIISHGINGYLYESGDYIELANLILHAISNQKQSNELIRRGKEKAVTMFSTDNYVKQIINAYHSILNQRE